MQLHCYHHSAKKYSDSVSIIIPAYNEEQRLIHSLKVLILFCRSHFFDFEIICVDDGSTDQTWKIIEQLCRYSFVKGVRLLQNSGKGEAVRQGMRAACGRFRFFTDADLPYATDSFLRALDLFQITGCDLVVGARDLEDSQESIKVSNGRKLAGKLFSLITTQLFDTGFQDTQCGFKGFTAHAAEFIFRNLTLTGYSFDIEIFTIAEKLGFTIEKMPVNLVMQRESKIRLFHDPFLMLFELARIYLGRNRPLRR